MCKKCHHTVLLIKLELLDGISLACECATTIDKHCTHSSAFLPLFGFSISDWSPVNISNAFGMLRAPLHTLTLLIWCTSIGVTSLSSFWNKIHIFRTLTKAYQALTCPNRHLQILCTTDERRTTWNTAFSIAWTASTALSSPSAGPRLPADCPAESRWRVPGGCTENSTTNSCQRRRTRIHRRSRCGAARSAESLGPAHVNIVNISPSLLTIRYCDTRFPKH